MKKFEGVDAIQQIRLVQSADVLVIARGAASIFAAALKPGSGFLSLFPVDERPVSVANDNFPWWPYPLLRNDVGMRFVACQASPPLNGTAQEMSNCKDRSVNFCDMKCDAGHVGGSLRSLIDDLRASIVRVRFLDTQCDDTGRCVYAAKP